MTVVYTDKDGKSYAHELTVTWTVAGTKRKLKIEVAPTALCYGDVENSEAYVTHVDSARFPSGRGVGYLMLHHFALEVIKYCFPAPTIGLGTPVNAESVAQAEEKEKKQLPSERAAVHVYEQCGFDVSTAEKAIASKVTPIHLRDATKKKIEGRWSHFVKVKI